jgi:hypothetical protein
MEPPPSTHLKKMRKIGNTSVIEFKKLEVLPILEEEEISLPWKEPYWIKYVSYFPQKDPEPRDPEDWANNLRVRARKEKLSRNALRRLEWFLFLKCRGKGNVSFTSRHFGISRKTFYLWQKRFKEGELSSLEERSRAPQRKRAWQVTPEEDSGLSSCVRRTCAGER